MRNSKQKVTDSHIERILALDAATGILNYQDMAPEEAKAELFAMGERGEGRPKNGHPLFGRFNSYISKSNQARDPVFKEKHSKQFPEWYISRSAVASLRKERFIQEQEDGWQKPPKGSRDLKFFESYTIPSSGAYDPLFIKNCATIENNWLAKKVVDGSILKRRKRELLSRIMKKKSRPPKNTALGSTLCNIASKSNRRYDKKLISKLRCLSDAYNLGWFNKRKTP